MPLVQIDVIDGRTPDQLQALADGVQQAMVEVFAAPGRDRYQVIQEHPSEQLIVLDTGLGIERSDRAVVVQVTEQGRTDAQKTALHARLAQLLDERGIVRPDDLVVSVVENMRADWWFGFGRAQFLTGELG